MKGSTAFSTDYIKTYLQEIGRVSLLTHEEEITLGKSVQTLVALEELRGSLAEKMGSELTDQQWAAAANISVEELLHSVRKASWF